MMTKQRLTLKEQDRRIQVATCIHDDCGAVAYVEVIFGPVNETAKFCPMCGRPLAEVTDCE